MNGADRQRNQELLGAAAAASFAVDAAYCSQDQLAERRRRLMSWRRGRERVQAVMAFAQWFCQKLLDGQERMAVCSVRSRR